MVTTPCIYQRPTVYSRDWLEGRLEFINYPPPISQSFVGFTEEDIAGIEKYVIFVGYARSGTSIIGSLLDAHPNMIIAHEYMIFKTWLLDDKNRDTLNGNRSYVFNELHQKSYRASCLGSRSEHKERIMNAVIARDVTSGVSFWLRVCIQWSLY